MPRCLATTYRRVNVTCQRQRLANLDTCAYHANQSVILARIQWMVQALNHSLTRAIAYYQNRNGKP